MMGGVSMSEYARRSNCVKYEPIDIQIQPSFGDRVDAGVSYLCLQWLGTFRCPYPRRHFPGLGAFLPPSVVLPQSRFRK